LTCHTCGSSLAVANTAPLAPGTTLKGGGYRLLKVLGQGGFGITYKAIRNSTGRYCAVKEFFPASGVTRAPDGQVTPGATFKDDFERGKLAFREEAARLASFKHASIVSVIETFEERGTAFLVMEYLEGQTLEQRIASGNLLTELQAMALLKPLLEALHEVHSRGYLHRDIKPANIVLTDARPELIDFGTAITFKRGQSVNVSALVLTPDYAPLEQYATHAKLGPYTDLYALAATCYEAITGVKPPPSLERANGVNLQPIRDLKPSISVGFAAILEKALSIPVAQRIATATQMHELLRKHERKTRVTSFVDDLPIWFSAIVIISWVLFLASITANAFNSRSGSTPVSQAAGAVLTQEPNPPVIYFKATQATYGALKCKQYVPFISVSLYKNNSGAAPDIGWDFNLNVLDPHGKTVESTVRHWRNWFHVRGTEERPSGTYRLKGTADGRPLEVTSTATIPTQRLETPKSFKVRSIQGGQFLQVEWDSVRDARMYAMDNAYGHGERSADQPRALRMYPPSPHEQTWVVITSINLSGPKVAPVDRNKQLRASVLLSRPFTIEEVQAAGGVLDIAPKNPCSF
jgi:serine/threonine protein kinase